MDKITTQWLKEAKQRGEKIPVLTAYDYPMARLLDEAGVPVLLVGD
jgi:3-methyl-2-oxobutanoate hydroxymethyltransferase